MATLYELNENILLYIKWITIGLIVFAILYFLRLVFCYIVLNNGTPRRLE